MPANLLPPQIAIIDCGAGNLHSVRKALARVMPEGATLHVTTEANDLASATHIVLPGVGAFADCMKGLTSLPGMRTALETQVLERRTPFFGICVGMQMLFQRGYEHGEHSGLGWFDGEVRKITPSDTSLRIPHMGWNRLNHSPQRRTEPHPVLRNIPEGAYAYFVHSFAATGIREEELLSSVDYGGRVVALIGRDHILGAQFHPEKSQKTGLTLLKNFLDGMHVRPA